MKIACIGWGSLIWNPSDLKIKGKWFYDGPYLPIEFARQSTNGRITLVIEENSAPIQTMWILMNTNDINEASESLRKREGTIKKHIHKIGINDTPENSVQKSIHNWLQIKEIDFAIWTGLPSKFNNKNSYSPNYHEIIHYIDSCKPETFNLIKEYFINTPKQIDTEIRRRINENYNW